MSYDAAIQKAWLDISAASQELLFTVKFLADEYSVDVKSKKVFSLSCNTPVKDFTAILILHYLERSLQGLPAPTSDWVSFKEIPGGDAYYPAFRKRSIDPIIRKYGTSPEGLLGVLERMPGRRINHGDIGIVIQAFDKVELLITLWKADEEFGPDANILFDKNITEIFCTEDIVVMAGMVAGLL